MMWHGHLGHGCMGFQPMQKLGSKANRIQLIFIYFPSPSPIFESGEFGIAPDIFNSVFQLIHILYQPVKILALPKYSFPSDYFVRLFGSK